jgi:hypothetical protein
VNRFKFYVVLYDKIVVSKILSLSPTALQPRMGLGLL